MKKNTISIDIKKPVSVVFRFTVNPNNTPKWIPSIAEERTREPNVNVGTTYYQKLAEGGKSELVVTEFVENKKLGFRLLGSNYTCSYLYEKTASGTSMTYSEENGGSEIESPMMMENLLTLKRLIENA
jgi:hypothetical protein